MNVLIVENEKPAIAGLKNLLKKIDSGIVIMGAAESVESTMNWLSVNPLPDLIFMDIQLDDGLCFELFESMKLDVPVIFTTAYDAYMLSAFKVNSVDYLLKPIEEASLRMAIDKFKSIHFKGLVINDVLRELQKEINKGYKSRFLIKVGAHYKSVHDVEVSCFYILERAVFIRTLTNRDFLLDYSLDYIQKVIDPGRFFRINRSCIVNINAIADMICYSSSRLSLKLISQPIGDLIVSKDKVSEFKSWIDK